MIKYIAIFLVLSSLCFSARAGDITSKWNDLEHGYKTLMSMSHYARATKLAGEMLMIDPSSNKARFYLAYAYRKANTSPPEWLFSEPWSEGSAEDKFYKLLASDLAVGN